MEKLMARNRSGQGFVEYAIIMVLVVVNLLLILQITGVNIKSVYCSIVNKLGGSSTCETYCKNGFASLSEWSLLGNTGWEAQNGMMCNTKANEMRAYSSCSLTQKISDDYVIEFDSAVLKSGNGYGIFYRMQSKDPTEGYVFQYDPGASGFVVRKWVNNWEVNPAIAFVNASTTNWYNVTRKIKLEVKGPTMKAYVDGKLVLTATDSTYLKGGGVGVRTWDSTTACFGDFTVSPLP
jgi:Flp pilus assembly pilin Flp